MPVKSTTSLAVLADIAGVRGLQRIGGELERRASLSLEPGTGPGHANVLHASRRVLAPSAVLDLDLSTDLVDGLGAPVSLAMINVIAILPSSANSNSILVGGAPTNPFSAMFATATTRWSAHPGGLALSVSAAGFAVVPGSADILRFANGGGGSAVEFDLIIVGVSGDPPTDVPVGTPLGLLFLLTKGS